MGVSDCRKSAYSVADIPGFFKFKFTIADHWEAVTVLIFIGLGIYMIWKGLRSETFLNSSNDEIELEENDIFGTYYKCRCISCRELEGDFWKRK